MSNAAIDDDLDDEDDDDQEPQNETDLVKKLRKDLKSANKRAAKTDELERENAGLKQEKAIRDAKLELKPSQQKALLAAHEGEMTPEALRETAVDLGFAEAEPDVPDEDLDAQDRIDAASRGAESTESGVLTPDKLKDWSTEKFVRFKKQYPDEFEALKRGEPVQVVF